jgi:hypothetical protein
MCICSINDIYLYLTFISLLRVLKTTKGSSSFVNFCVPTGNFGNILAGYYARRMGLPVGKLVICTNENNVLHRCVYKAYVCVSYTYTRIINCFLYMWLLGLWKLADTQSIPLSEPSPPLWTFQSHRTSRDISITSRMKIHPLQLAG